MVDRNNNDAQLQIIAEPPLVVKAQAHGRGYACRVDRPSHIGYRRISCML
jgi:hypothetical protein